MRISRHQMYMDMAEVLTRRSTCYRGNVGALLVTKDGILSEGYNGPPAGHEHCQGNRCPLMEGSCSRSDHAELNALIRARSKRPRQKSLNDCILYCTSAPCKSCAELILSAGINSVFFRNYYKTSEGLDFLRAAERPLIYRLTPSGYLVNERTGRIEDA